MKPKTGGVIPQCYSAEAPEARSAGFGPRIYRTCYSAVSAKNRAATSTSAPCPARCNSAIAGHQVSGRGYTLR